MNSQDLEAGQVTPDRSTGDVLEGELVRELPSLSQSNDVNAVPVHLALQVAWSILLESQSRSSEVDFDIQHEDGGSTRSQSITKNRDQAVRVTLNRGFANLRSD